MRQNITKKDLNSQSVCMPFNKRVATKTWISNKERNKKDRKTSRQLLEDELYTLEVEDEIHTLDFKLCIYCKPCINFSYCKTFWCISV